MSEIVDIVNTLQTEFPQESGNHRAHVAILLSSLGYIPEFDDEPATLDDGIITSASAAFASDFNEAKLISNQEKNEIIQIYGDNSLEFYLQRCLDVDEGITFTALPQFGDKNLKVRIIHYRLKLMGVYSGPIEAYYNAASHEGLTKLADKIDKTLLSTCNFLADLQEYTVRYLQFTGYKSPVSIFKLNTTALENLTDAEGNVYQLHDYTGAFKRTVKRELTSYPAIFNQLKKSIFKRRDNKVDLDVAQQMSQDPNNEFVIRLIQIHQWMAGFYDGKLDGDLGPVTIQSLLEVIRSYNEAGEDIDEKRALVVLVEKEGIIAFNTIFFLNKYKLEHAQADRSIQALEAINDSFQKANEEQQKTFETNFQKQLSNVRDGVSISATGKQGFIHRALSGIRAFFKKIFKFARKIFGWIVREVKRVASFLQNFIKRVYELVKEAAKHFIEGVKFLFGELSVVSGDKDQSIITHFDLDKDVLNISHKLDQALLELHQAKVSEKVNSLQFSLLLIAFFFKTINLLIGMTIAWPIFIFKLAKSFKQVVNQYKKFQTS